VGSKRLSLAVVWLGSLVAVGALPGAATGVGSATARLKLDGVPFRPELAMTPGEHSVGLMNRRKAPADGMLFVFRQDTTGAFWMKNTLVPLTIVFFDRDGKRVRRMSMTPCRRDPCPLYSPRRTYRFALELRVSDTRPALMLGPLVELRRLSRRAG
jgi:uncharacterized membrane protein (UPF0127 family)